MGDIPRYLLHAVGKKENIKMEDEREDEEEGIIYYGDSDIYGEECNKLESAREEAMVEKVISLEEEMVVDDRRKILDGYMKYYFRSFLIGTHLQSRREVGSPILMHLVTL